MSELFKTKIWLKEKKKMIYLDLPEIGYWKSGFYSFHDGHVDPDEYISLSDCIVMKPTGLKDKNGKEIYEGDIIRTPYNMWYEYCYHLIKWDEENEKWTTERKKLIGYDISDTLEIREQGNGTAFLHTKSEVIGNIYENPELIK